MMHDIAHCNNDSCPSASRCYRYLAHLEAKAKGLDYLAYFFFEEEEVSKILENKRCGSFWPTGYIDNDEYDYGHNVENHEQTDF